MPTYEYRCRDCGSHLEVVQAFTDDPLTECSSCGGTLRKVFGSIGITFKGSGFYKTDTRAAAGNGGAKEKAGEKAGEAGKDTEKAGAGAKDKSDTGGPKDSSSGDKAAKKTAGKTAEAKSA